MSPSIVATLTLELRQGATVITSWDVPLTQDLDTVFVTLTDPEAALITDGGNLQLALIADGNEVQVTWFELDPDFVGASPSASASPSLSPSASTSPSGSASFSLSASDSPSPSPGSITIDWEQTWPIGEGQWAGYSGPGVDEAGNFVVGSRGRVRVYDPDTGQWSSLDPLGLSDDEVTDAASHGGLAWTADIDGTRMIAAYPEGPYYWEDPVTHKRAAGRLFAYYGEAWHEQLPAGNVLRQWRQVAISGSKMVAYYSTIELQGAFWVTLGGRLYTSNGNGAPWVEQMPAGDADQLWTSVSMDGDTILAAIDNGRLWRFDGVAWTELWPLGMTDQAWTRVSVAGSYMIATVSNGLLYYSADSGATWSEHYLVRDPINHDWGIPWGGVAVARDGTALVNASSFLFYYDGHHWSETWPDQPDPARYYENWGGIAWNGRRGLALSSSLLEAWFAFPEHGRGASYTGSPSASRSRSLSPSPSISPSPAPESVSTHPLLWIEWDAGQGDLETAAEVRLADPAGYYGGMKPPRLLGVSAIRRALSGPQGDYETGRFEVTLADPDRSVRALLGAGGWMYRPVMVRLIDDEGRRLMRTPRLIGFGEVAGAPAYDGHTVTLRMADVVGSQRWTATGE